MKLVNFLFACLITATSLDPSATNDSWYNCLSNSLHSRLESIDSQFKRFKTATWEYAGRIFGSARNQIKKWSPCQKECSFGEFINRIKAYVQRGRQITKEDKELEEKKKLAEKRKEEEDKTGL